MEYTLRIERAQQRQYPRLAFSVPEGAERVTVSVRYVHYAEQTSGEFTCRTDNCVIDLALEAPDGRLFGAAGSDRESVSVSPLGSSAGFACGELPAGTWHVIAGAYHVPEHGVEAVYTIEIEQKRRRLFFGDTHVHSVASDGVSTLPELAALCRQEGLDFLFLTDHNNVSAPAMLENLTVLPGVEWTHYNGHAGLLGSDCPLPGRYDTSDLDQTRAFLSAAHAQGAFTVLNHPFCPVVPWLWGFDLPFDGVEVWNGAMCEHNERAAAWWHAQLCTGRRLPAVGGSDYHKPGLFGGVGVPCMCLYALSRSPGDLMDALKNGRGFIRYQPDGPGLDMRAENGASFSDEAPCGAAVTFMFTELCGGDEIRLITDLGMESIRCPEQATRAELTRSFPGARFVRAELYRCYASGLPPMKTLLGNPIYFA